MEAGSTRKILRSAGFAARISPGTRPAVVVVDLIEGFTSPECSAGADLTDVVVATGELIDEARVAGVPTIFTVLQFRADGSDAGIWLEKAPGLGQFIEGSRWIELDSRLPATPADLRVFKRGASAFFGTGLSSILTSGGFDTIVLCGATTSGCVRATAIDALQSSFRCLVPEPCVGDRAPAAHEASLLDIDAKYADVVTLQEAKDYLRRVAEAAGERP